MSAEVWLAFSWMPWLIVLPLALAAVSFLTGPRGLRLLALLGMALMVFAAAALACQVAIRGAQRHSVGAWDAPLGIELYADGLSALLIGMTALVTAFIGAFALRYFSGDTHAQRYFWPLTWFLWAAMNAIYLSADAFNLYVTLELLSLAAVGLVVLTGGAPALAAGMRYLLAALVGSLAYLLGVALLYGAYGTLALATLASAVAPGPGVWLAAALMTLGLALKTALFPLHFWLPPVHGGTPPPVSALLSALVVKASFYVLLRLWFGVFAGALTPVAAQVLGWLGAGAILWGSLLAVRQKRLKMLIAYSTVAQIGYLFLVFPLAAHTPPEAAASAWHGGVYQALSHAFAKAAMFLAAGAMIAAMRRDEIAHLEGLGTHQPLNLFTFGLAGMSLMGLPPSGGFIAKWMLLEGALRSGQWWWIVVIIVGGLLSAAYVFRVLQHAFVPATGARRFRPVSRVMALLAFALAVIALGLGVVTEAPLALLAVGAPFVQTSP